MAVERKPGLFWKRWDKILVSFSCLMHIKINGEVKLTHYFNHLILKCVWNIEFTFLVQFILSIIRIQEYVKFIMLFRGCIKIMSIYH